MRFSNDSGAGAGLHALEDSDSRSQGNSASGSASRSVGFGFDNESEAPTVVSDTFTPPYGKFDSESSAKENLWIPEGPIEEAPRKPMCACVCCRCCSTDVHTVAATYEEIVKLKKNMKHLTLTEDVVIGGELIKAKSHLLRIGRKWRRRAYWEISDDQVQKAHEHLKEHVDEEMNVRLTFKCPSQWSALPWCVPLKCPCCVFIVSLALVGVLMVLGMAPIAGKITIDTNFDSFMDSDSDSSLYYNAFLNALENKPEQNGKRRLNATEPNSAEPYSSLSERMRQQWLDFQELRYMPDLDDKGRWHPARFLSKVAFGDGGLRESGSWLSDHNSSQSGRRLSTGLYKLHQMQLTYVTLDESSIIKKDFLRRIHTVEEKLKALAEWKELCEEAEPATKRFCSPGVSFANIVYAMRRKEPLPSTATILYFNGSGDEPLPLEIATGFAKEQNILPLLFPSEVARNKDYHVETLPCFDQDQKCGDYKNAGYCKPFSKYESYMQDFCPSTCNFCGPAAIYGSNPSSDLPTDLATVTAIRSHFRFQAFCCFSMDDSAKRSEGVARLTEIWSKFIVELVRICGEASDDKLQFLYTGDSIEGYEAMAAVANDLRYAGGSYCFVLLYATLHTRSIFLASVGLFLVMLSIPSAASIFFMASGGHSVSLMSCLSIFIVIGIGSDMLFVYTDFWKQSVTHSRDSVKRLKFTYTQAASSTAATTFTTAMSFLANLASVLRPLREFGFFMGACVVSAWLIVFFAYPPILVLGERCHRRLRHHLTVNASQQSQDIQQQLQRANSFSGRRSVAVAAMSRRSSVAFASMLDPEKKGVGEVHKNFLGNRFADLVRDWKCCLLIVFTILTVGSLGMAMRNATQASGTPQIFPDEHNQVMGKKYDTQFKNWDKDIADRAQHAATECNNLFEDCSQFRCETHGRAMGSPSDCQCYPYGAREGKNCNNPRMLRVNFRVLGRQGLPMDAVRAANLSTIVETTFPQALEINAFPKSSHQAECLVESWDTGRQRLVVMTDPGHIEITLRDRLPSDGPEGAESTSKNKEPWHCLERQLCYCGLERCAGSTTGMGSGVLRLDIGDGAGGRRLGQFDDYQFEEQVQTHPLNQHLRPRHLQDDEEEEQVQIKPSEMVDVNIIMGMKVTGKSPMLGVQKEQPWKYEENFNLQDPWAQRKFEKLCKTMKGEKQLKIMKLSCWLNGFRDNWMARGEDWPVRPIYDMNKEVISYATTFMTEGLQTTTFIWIVNNEVKATYFPCILTISKFIAADEAMEVMGEWDKFVDDFNDAAEEAIKGIWHASKLWVRSEAEKVIIDSTLTTLAISLGCVWLGIFLFTQSMHLAFLVMIVVMAIIICLLFFMTVLMEWPIGAIEVLSLIVFVGFAVDYCLHVAHKYHTCHINAVEEKTEEDEEGLAPALSESPGGDGAGSFRSGKARSRISGIGSRSPRNSSNSGGSGGKRSMRRSTIAIDIGDKPQKRDDDPHTAQAAKKLLAANRPEERYRRTSYALERMGGAVIGSALTTVGCAAFLVPCQLLVFVKIGSVVMAVTLYAILYTILPLPALLMACGPCGNDWNLFVQHCRRKLAILRGQKVDDDKDKEDERSLAPRRYVLHMPTRAMGAQGPGVPATRTRVTASG